MTNEEYKEIVEKLNKKFPTYEDISLYEYIFRWNKLHLHKPKDRFAIGCHKCDGEGKCYREEEYDPYEGHKLSNKYMCEHCNGTGEISLEEIKTYFVNEIDNKRSTSAYNASQKQKSLEILNSLRDYNKMDIKNFVNFFVGV